MPIVDVPDFWTDLRINSFNLSLSDSVKSSRSNDGVIYTAASGVRLWQGSVTTSTWTREGQRQLNATVSTLVRPGHVFNLSANIIPTTETATAQVNGVQTSGYSIDLKNCPINRRFIIGDYISFQINGCHRLYQIAANATANSMGNVTLTLTHPLTVGAIPANNTAVRIDDPRLTAQIIPGSLNYSEIGLASSSGYSFQFIQAVRA